MVVKGDGFASSMSIINILNWDRIQNKDKNVEMHEQIYVEYYWFIQKI